MSSTQAAPLKVPEWATTLMGQIGPEPFIAGCNALESLFYGNLSHTPIARGRCATLWVLPPINFVDLFLEAVTNTGLSAPVQIR